MNRSNQLQIKLENIPEENRTTEICKKAIKQNPQSVQYVPKKYRGIKLYQMAIEIDPETIQLVPRDKLHELFDESTKIEVIEHILRIRYKLIRYMPNRADVRSIVKDIMNCNEIIAYFMPEEMKRSDDILNFQKQKGMIKIEEKQYIRKINRFQVLINVICHDDCDINEKKYSYDIEKQFISFIDFYNFNDKNLSDADLTKFNFKNIDLKEFNIQGAIIDSRLLSKYGLYDDRYYRQLENIISSDYIDNHAHESSVRELSCSKRTTQSRNIYLAESTFKINYKVYYISDIHLEYLLDKHFKKKGCATYNEIKLYIQELASKLVQSFINDGNSIFLFAGDTSACFEYSRIFYHQIARKLSCTYCNANRIIAILGNHELRDESITNDSDHAPLPMEKMIDKYRFFFNDEQISFLFNELIWFNHSNCSPEHLSESDILNMSEEEIRNRVYGNLIILGGIGFSGLNSVFNAKIVPYGISFDTLSSDDKLQKDKYESERFNNVYLKIYNSLYYSKVIVLTHTPKPNWNDTPYNPNWIYVSGHTHRNVYKWDDECKIIADNQVGYHNTKIGFKSFWLEPPEDVFINFIDGIHKITKGQYMEFNHSKGIISYSNRKMIDIYMIKKNKKYMFFAYCLPQERSKCKHLYMLCGGQIRRISSDDPSILSFYYNNLDKYVSNVNSLMSLYIPRLNALSQFVKLIGGSGNIHGCIIDIDIPESFFEFSRCHLYLNPLNNTYTAYYADSISSRLVYADLRTLLVEQKEYCKNMIESFDKNIAKYAEISANFLSSNSLSEIDDNFIQAEQSNSATLDNSLEMYRISRIIMNLRYCVDNDVVRIWNDNLLNFDFTNCVSKDRRIEAINNNQEIVTGNNIKNDEDHFD